MRDALLQSESGVCFIAFLFFLAFCLLTVIVWRSTTVPGLMTPQEAFELYRRARTWDEKVAVLLLFSPVVLVTIVGGTGLLAVLGVAATGLGMVCDASIVKWQIIERIIRDLIDWARGSNG